MIERIYSWFHKHDSYMTGMVVWMNFYSLLVNLQEQEYAWSALNVFFMIWFQYMYIRKKNNA